MRESVRSACGLAPLRAVGNRRGAMLVFVAVSMVGIAGFLAMTIDIGAASQQRRLAQTAADAAAISGAFEVYRGQYDSVSKLVHEEAARNGFAASKVALSYPPATGPYAGNSRFVEVVVDGTIPSLFGGIFNVSSLNVKARSVAGMKTASMSCVYALAFTGGSSLDLDGRLFTDCNVTVNSNASDAINIKSGSLLKASDVAVTGSYTGSVNPRPVTGVAPSPDPLAYVDMPTVGSCNYTTQVIATGTMTLSPGVYCGGIMVKTGAADVTLNPGTYIIAGGGLNVTSGRLTGNGVTIFLTNGPGNIAALYAPYSFGSGCKANLTAPTTGPYAGLLIMVDRNAGLPLVKYTNTFACSNDLPLGGTIYAPTQTLFFGGSNSQTEVEGAIVGKTIEVKEGTKLTITQPVASNALVKRLSLVQ